MALLSPINNEMSLDFIRQRFSVATIEMYQAN
jgi:hypothetical protein